MNHKIKYLLILIVLCAVFLTHPVSVKADTTLDEIQTYNITVDLRSDGSLDMDYKIRWKVLDSTSEGPLTWVKIGVPNRHVDFIKAQSDNIKNIEYYEESGQTYIRVDFDRAYYAGEVVDFEYSFQQGYMYTIDNDESIVTYKFTPGWFDEIEVKNLTINWNTSKVKESSSGNKDGNYFIWNTSLAKGQKYHIILKYDLNAYSFDPGKQQREDGSDVITGVVVVMVIVLIFIAAKAKGNGNYKGGFGGNGRRAGFIASSHRGGCVHSACACACACACAGGGRAGCSLKDFYGTKLQTNRIKKAVKMK